jgi:hypothetical protein
MVDQSTEAENRWLATVQPSRHIPTEKSVWHREHILARIALLVKHGDVAAVLPSGSYSERLS